LKNLKEGDHSEDVGYRWEDNIRMEGEKMWAWLIRLRIRTSGW